MIKDKRNYIVQYFLRVFRSAKLVNSRADIEISNEYKHTFTIAKSVAKTSQ